MGVLGADFPSDLKCEIAEPQSFLSPESAFLPLWKVKEAWVWNICRKERFKKWIAKSDQGGRLFVHQALVKRMLDYLNNGEVLKVNARELEFRALAPNE